jgi:hypothetical protein
MREKPMLKLISKRERVEEWFSEPGMGLGEKG